MKLVLSFVVALAALIAARPMAQACSCPPAPSIEQEYRTSRWIFVGTPIAVREVDLGSKLDRNPESSAESTPGFVGGGEDESPRQDDQITDRIYTFRVTEGYKGRLGRVIHVQANADTSCEIRFRLNEPYLLWLGQVGRSGYREISPCSRSTTLGEGRANRSWLERRSSK